MKLDEHFMRSILAMYDELIENGVYIVYIGNFTQKITTFFASLLEEEIEHNDDRKTKRKVYHTIVEVLQNMQRHTEEIIDNKGKKGLFMIGKKQGIYYIITINITTKNSVEKIKSIIDKVNASSIEQLRDMYKKQLKEGKIGESGGAGLGFIDIARKTKSKLEYLFIPVNLNYDYFVLKAEVDTVKLKANF